MNSQELETQQRMTQGGRGHWAAVVRRTAGDLSPAYFSMVMATGIISIGCHLLGLIVLSNILFWLNLAAFGVLWVLSLLRIIFHTRRVFQDMIDHQRGPGFFTWVAGTCIIGSQFIIIRHSYPAAITFWALALVLWFCFTYTLFTGLTVKENKPTLEKGISGAWLLAVVATQAVAVLSALIAEHWEQPYRVEMNFLALSLWLWGGMMYIWMISLIFYRYTFFRFSPDDLSPPYWINVGAMAISTLAGSILILNTHDAPFIKSLLPFLKGFTVFYWVTGTWWIPMMVILGVWRHIYKRFPLRYDPLYWGVVFPLGMYTTCTLRLAHALELDFLLRVPPVFLCIALTVWSIVFIGLVRRLWGHLRRELRAARR
jgi:tellurite resistance protein TehA-like permease